MCWLFHKWGKWEVRTKSGGDSVYQYRVCRRCNKTERHHMGGDSFYSYYP